MIVLDLSILNQKGTPMFNSDTFANRPAFGIVGRIFISIDTAAIYRDTGSAWDLIADGGSASTNIYNSNGTLSANRVVSDGGFGLSFTPTTHIGTAAIGGGGNGKLIVGSSTADNGIQIFGANAPSLRIDNAQSGGTQRFILGLATSTNNFIQGAIASDFCITTASAGAILFGMWQSINASEVMRITTANNLLVGKTTDTGERFQVQGTTLLNGSVTFSSSTGMFWDSANARLGIGTNTPTRKLQVIGTSALFQNAGDFEFDLLNSSSNNFLRLVAGTSDTTIGTIQNVALSFVMNGTRYGRFTSTNGNLILQNGGTFTDSGERFQLTGAIRVNGQTSGSAGGSSGQHLIINCDGTSYKIALLNT